MMELKATWGGMGLFHLILLVNGPSVRESGQELNQARNLEAGGMRAPLTGLLPIDVSARFLHSQDYLPMGDTAHSALGLATSIISQEKIPQTCL